MSPALTSTVLAFTVADALAVPMRWFEDTENGPVLRRGQRVRPGERVLLVEDVVTTGHTAGAVSEHVASDREFPQVISAGIEYAKALYRAMIPRVVWSNDCFK